MKKDDYKKDTLIIDIKHRKMEFYSQDDKTVEVLIKEKNVGGADIFQVLCCVAIMQDYYTNEKGVTKWPGITDEPWDTITNKFGWRIAHSSLTRRKYPAE